MYLLNMCILSTNYKNIAMHVIGKNITTQVSIMTNAYDFFIENKHQYKKYVDDI